MTKTAALRVVLGDQLTPGLSALEGLDPARDRVLMMEVMADRIKMIFCGWWGT